MRGKQLLKVDHALQRRRRALDVGVVDHDFAEHLGGIQQLEVARAALILVGRPAAVRVLEREQNVDRVAHALLADAFKGRRRGRRGCRRG